MSSPNAASNLSAAQPARTDPGRPTTVITYGTFDLLHEGHINLLRRAKALGNRLIVGVTSASYDRSRGKLNVKQSLAERIRNVERTGLADLIIVEEYEGQKIEDILRYNVDIFVIGSDWRGKFDYLAQYCKVVYLDRTRSISSTQLRGLLKLGIIGPGRIARRFLSEAKFVSGVSIEAVYHPDDAKANAFASEHELAWGGGDFDAFLSRVEAVYIATPHIFHVPYALRCLNSGKHVLVEKPLALNRRDAEQLYEIASNKKLILTEALKTAYLPAFRRMIATVLSGAIGEPLHISATFTKLLPATGREFDPSLAGGSFTELSSYVLLPICKLFHPHREAAQFAFTAWRTSEHAVDYGAAISVVCPPLRRTAHALVGIGLKAEGELVISGTKGYIYVPAPWWKTAYFELRNEDPAARRIVSDSFEGDGLRYELADFLAAVQQGHPPTALSPDESIWIASVIEQFLNRHSRLDL